MQSRAEVFDGASRKRALTDQEGLDAKRQRVEPSQPELQITPLKPGPHSLADVFTFTQNEGLRTFDVSLVPAPLAAKISVMTIARVDPKLLDMAINVGPKSIVGFIDCVLTLMLGYPRPTYSSLRGCQSTNQPRNCCVGC